MIVDAVILLIAAILACLLRGRVAYIIVVYQLAIFAAVHLWWERSQYWYVEYLADYHFSLAIINSLFCILLLTTVKRYHLVKIATGLLVVVNLSVFYTRIAFLDGLVSEAFYQLVLNNYSTARLIVIALQLAGVAQYARGIGGRRLAIHTRHDSAAGSYHRYRLSFAKIHKRT